MQYTVPMPAEGHTGCECDQWDQKDFCLPSAQESKVNKMSLVLGAAALLYVWSLLKPEQLTMTPIYHISTRKLNGSFNRSSGAR